MTIRVVLPEHLQVLAGLEGEVRLAVAAPVTQQRVLDALERAFPPLRGTLRDPVTGKRRSLVRLFACREDLSHQPLDTPLPAAVAEGVEPLIILGAIAGG